MVTRGLSFFVDKRMCLAISVSESDYVSYSENMHKTININKIKKKSN